MSCVKLPLHWQIGRFAHEECHLWPICTLQILLIVEARKKDSLEQILGLLLLQKYRKLSIDSHQILPTVVFACESSAYGRVSIALTQDLRTYFAASSIHYRLEDGVNSNTITNLQLCR